MDERSKHLSYLLRHKPENAGLTLDSEGWCDVADLIFKTNFTLSELQEIVASDTKQRYSLSETRIRANQGHSTSSVKLIYPKAIPPVTLFHGTHKRALPAILKQGLLPMNRHHVHLSADVATAETVGKRRRGELIVLKIDCKEMVKNGIPFYLSENNVWLVDKVEPQYLSI